VIIGTAPLPDNVAALCTRGGRFGAHNLNPAFPDAVSAQLKYTFVGTFAREPQHGHAEISWWVSDGHCASWG
jgi:hypothetical protein